MVELYEKPNQLLKTYPHLAYYGELYRIIQALAMESTYSRRKLLSAGISELVIKAVSLMNASNLHPASTTMNSLNVSDKSTVRWFIIYVMYASCNLMLEYDIIVQACNYPTMIQLYSSIIETLPFEEESFLLASFSCLASYYNMKLVTDTECWKTNTSLIKGK
jgi:hypothetical protein